MQSTQHRANHLQRLIQWPLLCAMLCMAFARVTPATSLYYTNNNVFSVLVPPGLFPTIDANNFLNNSSFEVDFSASTVNQELFETLNTFNYTNYGTMTSDSGFRFDLQTTNNMSPGPRQMAGNFYNHNEIECASTNDTNAYLLGVGQCIIWATNIFNSGTIDVGGDGLLQFTGLNVNLSRSELIIEGNVQTSTFNNLTASNSIGGFGTYQNNYGIAGLYGVDYGTGTDSNLDWIPSVDLTTNSATSSEFTTALLPLAQLTLPNSTPYFDIRTPGTNDTVVRAVFLMNTIPGVSNSVYIDQNTGGLNFGAGAAHVVWSAPYIDPSSGLPATNYLYLTDDYLGGANNPNINNNIPNNFTFSASGTPAFPEPPTQPGFPMNFNFNPGVVTNTYSYANVQFSATTVATNSPSPNVTNYLAILPGRIEINAGTELNLNSADITGPNYISINSPNQFDGSSGAQIYAPYADINIGVTNGFLTVSNLLQSGSERWSGTLQIWSATWLLVDTNGATNDYRVLLVNSQLSPTTPSYVQNLTLHGTNSTLISDALNVISTFSDDSQNLTVTANGPGAFSPAGELNLLAPGISWNVSTPNLRNLTNNGSILLQNFATFGVAPPSEYYSLINNGTISDFGSSVWADNFASGGVFASALNSFTLQSQTTTLTNGLLSAGADVSITTSNLFATNSVILSGQQLAIVATNASDGGVTSGNFWSVGGKIGIGLNVPVKPAGDLLGTTITNIAPDNEAVANTWPGEDFGASVAGFSNNLAVGRLVLDSLASLHPPPRTEFTFNGPGASNAIYVDELILANAATNLDNDHNVQAFDDADGNVTIYYARALAGGNDVSEQLDYKNNKHLRWVPAYVGHFSSTNLVYTNIFGGMTNFSTNTVNAALAQSPDLDSDGDGTNNASDPTPFFVSSQVNFKLTVTNEPPLTILLSWDSIPASTNYVYYATNLMSANWQVLTNFISPSAVPPVGGWPITNSASDAVNPAAPRFYQIRVVPNNADFYGPY